MYITIVIFKKDDILWTVCVVTTAGLPALVIRLTEAGDIRTQHTIHRLPHPDHTTQVKIVRPEISRLNTPSIDFLIQITQHR